MKSTALLKINPLNLSIIRSVSYSCHHVFRNCEWLHDQVGWGRQLSFNRSCFISFKPLKCLPKDLDKLLAVCELFRVCVAPCPPVWPAIPEFKFRPFHEGLILVGADFLETPMIHISHRAFHTSFSYPNISFLNYLNFLNNLL